MTAATTACGAMAVAAAAAAAAAMAIADPAPPRTSSSISHKAESSRRNVLRMAQKSKSSNDAEAPIKLSNSHTNLPTPPLERFYAPDAAFGSLRLRSGRSFAQSRVAIDFVQSRTDSLAYYHQGLPCRAHPMCIRRSGIGRSSRVVTLSLKKPTPRRERSAQRCSTCYY